MVYYISMQVGSRLIVRALVVVASVVVVVTAAALSINPETEGWCHSVTTGDRCDE